MGIKEWAKEMKNSTKENIEFLHPCFPICGKWDVCESKAECLEKIDMLGNIWRGKVIANAYCALN